MPDGIAPPVGKPPAEFDITNELVLALLESQHPDLAGLELSQVGSGWDNTTYRLGADLAVRLPRREQAVDLIRNEQRWLPELAPTLPVSTPVTVRVGSAEFGYPWPWSIVPWFGGTDAVVAPLRSDQATLLGRALRALHRPAPSDAPWNPARSGPLAERASSVERRLARLEQGSLAIGLDQVASEWARLKTLPIDTPAVWIHGDIHARNVISADGQLRALIDWGDMCVGDRATDLAAAWMLFPTHAHGSLREAYGIVSEATWERARGSAIHMGVVLVDVGDEDDPAWAEIGRRALERACYPS